jgi:hypothetical protein
MVIVLIFYIAEGKVIVWEFLKLSAFYNTGDSCDSACVPVYDGNYLGHELNIKSNS